MEELLTPYIIAFIWASILIPFGVIVRSKIVFFQKFLFPSSLLAGLVGMVLINLGVIGYPSPNGWVRVDFGTFINLTNLFFSLAFTLIGLAAVKGGNSKGMGKEIFRGTLWIGVLYAAVYMLQLLIGVGVISAWNAVTGAGLETATGFLAGIGFAGGPGSVTTYAQIWQKSGLPDVVTVGVTYAAMGYIVAAFVGVPIANWGIRKGMSAATRSGGLDRSFLSGLMEPGKSESMGIQTTHSANLDSLSFHVALGAIAYGVSWTICYMLKYFILPPAYGMLTFNLLYIWGLFGGILTRLFINKSGAGHRVDSATINRLIGLCVDYVIVTCLLGVKFAALTRYIGPMLITVMLIALISSSLVWWFSKRLNNFGLERFLSTFGMLTGTVSNSLVLLRITDPEFKTTVPVETGLATSVQIILLMPMYLMYAIMPTTPWLGTIGLTKIISIHCVIFFLLMFILQKFFFKKDLR
jgi:ESS family glutamate:Na+ symporter